VRSAIAVGLEYTPITVAQGDEPRARLFEQLALDGRAQCLTHWSVPQGIASHRNQKRRISPDAAVGGARHGRDAHHRSP